MHIQLAIPLSGHPGVLHPPCTLHASLRIRSHSAMHRNTAGDGGLSVVQTRHIVVRIDIMIAIFICMPFWSHWAKKLLCSLIAARNSDARRIVFSEVVQGINACSNGLHGRVQFEHSPSSTPVLLTRVLCPFVMAANALFVMPHSLVKRRRCLLIVGVCTKSSSLSLSTGSWLACVKPVAKSVIFVTVRKPRLAPRKRSGA